jgi:hypothetical protein
MITRLARVMLAGMVCVGAAGCRHKVTPAPVIPPPTPVVVATPPVPSTPAQLPTETAGTAPLGTVPVVPGKPAKKVAKKVAPAPAPVEVAAATPPPPPPIEIGTLTAAGSDTGANRKSASELLAANEKRLVGLSASVKDKQKDQVGRVRSFQAEGIKALRDGDSDAAMNLATKAKVLLDEMVK